MFVDLIARPLQLPTDLTNVGLRANSYIGPTSLIPEECQKAAHVLPCTTDQKQVSRTPIEYSSLVNQWFFSGLSSVKFNIAPHVMNSEREVMGYFRAIMRSYAPKHEVKTAYLAYLLTQTCTSVEWTPA